MRCLMTPLNLECVSNRKKSSKATKILSSFEYIRFENILMELLFQDKRMLMIQQDQPKYNSS